VKYSFDRIFDPATASGVLATIQPVIKEVKITGEYEITIELYNPDILILDTLTDIGAFTICPVDAAKWGVKDFGIHPCGTGPFKFVEWVRDDHVTVTKNPDYNWAAPFTNHVGPAKLDEIIFRIIPEPTVRIQAVQAGELHVDAAPSANFIPNMRNDSRVRVLEVQGSRVDFCSFNTIEGNYPWNITEMRRAVVHAIDKQGINIASAFGLNTLASSPCAPAIMASWWNDKLANYTEYNPALAKQMLDNQGWVMSSDGYRYKNGVQLKIDLIEPSKKYTNYLDVALVLIDNFKAVGINVNFQDLDRDTWYSLEVAGNFDVTCAGLSGADITGIQWFFDPINIPWPDWMRVNNTELMNNIKLGREQTSIATAKPYFDEVQKIIVEEAYWDPIYYPTVFKIVNNSVENLPQPPVYFNWIYLDTIIK
jgi:peptide/nickel transport system substrate-binding protein